MSKLIERQTHQEEYLRSQELIELQYYNRLFHYGFTCRTCGISNSFHCAPIGIGFLNEHSGHDTGIETHPSMEILGAI